MKNADIIKALKEYQETRNEQTLESLVERLQKETSEKSKRFGLGNAHKMAMGFIKGGSKMENTAAKELLSTARWETIDGQRVQVTSDMFHGVALLEKFAADIETKVSEKPSATQGILSQFESCKKCYYNAVELEQMLDEWKVEQKCRIAPMREKRCVWEVESNGNFGVDLKPFLKLVHALYVGGCEVEFFKPEKPMNAYFLKSKIGYAFILPCRVDKNC